MRLKEILREREIDYETKREIERVKLRRDNH